MKKQCPNCQGWYSNLKGFKHHLRHCRRSIDDKSSEEVHRLIANPTLSIRSSSAVFASNRSVLSDEDRSYNHGDLIQTVDSDKDNNEDDSGFRPLRRKTMAVTKFQVMLNDLLLKHKASLLLYDEIIELVSSYISSPSFNKFDKFKSRRSLLQSTEKSLNTSCLRPVNGTVRLHNDSLVTVPIFDAKHMITSLLTDPSLMKESNFAEGYNVLTGEVLNDHPENKKYSEIHTGDAWRPARKRYCRNAMDMPVALIVFVDKTHTDLHGALSLTPIIFTLTLFNRASRNNPKFWRPLGYIPNLSYGKGKSDKTVTRDKIQDEHDCMSFVFKSLKNIHKNNGFDCTVLGQSVRVKIWIHFFIGDTEGNNKLVGQYPGNREGVKRPYRDCNCGYDDLSNPNPKCKYRKLDELREAKRRKRNDEDGGKEYYQSRSMYDIINALLDKNLPLSDTIHGLYKLFPPELLHTSGSGLIMYMFESLRHQIRGGQDRDLIDQLHIDISNIIKRQSERDFPRGSMRNGLIDGTKCQSSERKGNLFRLLCIAHTSSGGSVLKRCLKLSDSRWKQFIEFLKMYLSMEEWFHDANDKNEVRCAREEIAKVLQSLQHFFPRKDNTNGYNLPKMHGMTKMQEYMKLFGSGINFYGGPGESAHKQFIKIPGQRTQRRVSEFAQQTALQYHNMLVSGYAAEECLFETNIRKQYGGDNDQMESTSPMGDLSISLTGRYDFVVTEELLQIMESQKRVDVKWTFDDKNAKGSNGNHQLHEDFVRMLRRRLQTSVGTTVTGYTKAVISCSGIRTPFYAHPCFHGHKWYDWALVHFEEQDNQGGVVETHYPSRVLGYVSIDGKQEAAIQCSSKPILWNTVERKFIVPIKLGTDFNISFVTVPIDALVHPLCVFPDYSDGKCDTFYVVVPKRNWSRYFGDRIQIK